LRLEYRDHVVDIQYGIKISRGFILKFVKIQTIGHFLMFGLGRRDRNIVMKTFNG